MKDYTDTYVQIITDNDAYFGYVDKDDDSDFLRVSPIEWGNTGLDEDALKENMGAMGGNFKDYFRIRPFPVDIRKSIIRTIYTLPRNY